jgi:hypothetical protein
MAWMEKHSDVITRDIAPFMFRTQENFDTKDGAAGSSKMSLWYSLDACE